MEQVLAEEDLIEKKLKDLSKKINDQRDSFGSLRDIQTPGDLNALHRTRRETSCLRNSKFLQEVDIEAGKLHVKRLCPVDEKLMELKQKFFQNP